MNENPFDRALGVDGMNVRDDARLYKRRSQKTGNGLRKKLEDLSPEDYMKYSTVSPWNEPARTNARDNKAWQKMQVAEASVSRERFVTAIGNDVFVKGRNGDPVKDQSVEDQWNLIEAIRQQRVDMGDVGESAGRAGYTYNNMNERDPAAGLDPGLALAMRRAWDMASTLDPTVRRSKRKWGTDRDSLLTGAGVAPSHTDTALDVGNLSEGTVTNSVGLRTSDWQGKSQIPAADDRFTNSKVQAVQTARSNFVANRFITTSAPGRAFQNVASSYSPFLGAFLGDTPEWADRLYKAPEDRVDRQYGTVGPAVASGLGLAAAMKFGLPAVAKYWGGQAAGAGAVAGAGALGPEAAALGAGAVGAAANMLGPAVGAAAGLLQNPRLGLQGAQAVGAGAGALGQAGMGAGAAVIGALQGLKYVIGNAAPGALALSAIPLAIWAKDKMERDNVSMLDIFRYLRGTSPEETFQKYGQYIEPKEEKPERFATKDVIPLTEAEQAALDIPAGFEPSKLRELVAKLVARVGKPDAVRFAKSHLWDVRLDTPMTDLEGLINNPNRKEPLDKNKREL